MPNYSSLSTQVTAIKNEITSSLAASAYSAQDLVYVAKALQALGSVVAPDGVDNITVNNNIYLGATAESFASTAALTYPNLVIEVDNPDFSQIAFRNKNSGASASTDLILYSNNGNDASGYIDMGITSSNFSDPGFTATGKGDGYIFMVGADAGTDDRGNLVLATSNTGTQNKIVFAAGGLASNNTQMEIVPNSKIAIAINTPSTSPTTGALTVSGGVGISGDVYVAGNISFGGTGTTVQSNNLSVVDPMVYTGSSNSADAIDLGLVGKYVTGANTRYSGVVRDASDGVIKFFSNATTKPNTTVNFAEAGIAYSDVQVGTLSAAGASIGNVSNTELQYLDGVTSAIQTQIDAKLASATAAGTYAPITGATLLGTVTLPSTTSIGNVSATEIAYVDGVTSAIQTQLDAKLATATASSTYAPLTGAALVRPVLTSAFETISVAATQATGVINVDLGTAPVYYYTGNAAADFTFNARWNSSTTLNSILSIGQSVTFAFLVTNGSTAYKTLTTGTGAFQVDGVTVTPKWQGGTAPSSGNASSIDSYTFTIIKTASATYTVLAAQVKFA
jgi:hypothetical protein